jgi:beta-glucosidase
MFDAIFGGDKTPAWTEAEQKQEFDKAVQTARSADVVVMVLGERQNMDGEAASRSSLELPGVSRSCWRPSLPRVSQSFWF